MKFAIAITLAVALCHVSAVPSIPMDLKSQLLANGKADVMVVLRESVQSVINSINTQQYVNSVEKTTAMVAGLRQFTQKSQMGIVNFLSEHKISGVKTFWITNRILVPAASLQLVEKLVTQFGSNIAEVRLPIVATLDYSVDNQAASRPTAIEWGIERINAPAAWTDGFTGKGIVVSHIDTGVRPSHESLNGSLRDTHAWFDPYDGSPSPLDGNGHGTHTMGTIIGKGGIGGAPDSIYISCRGCDTANCAEDALLECGQFTTCPTQPDGSDEDCSKKPALSSNSWGGGIENKWFDDVIDAWVTANIIPIFAIGNEGPFCRSARSPGDRPKAFSVGATNNRDAVARFSSHGPTLITSRIKPEVSAPGNNIRSAGHLSDEAYATFSGTSMATPHVAAACAIILSKNKNLSINQVENLLKEHNVHPRLEQVICTGGGVNITYPWPNNSFGHGRIDVKLATDAAPAAP